MNETRGKHQSELDQIRQDYLKEKRRLEEECAELRARLEHMKHSKDEWTKEKQYLLQKVRNEKLKLSEMRQSKEEERSQGLWFVRSVHLTNVEDGMVRCNIMLERDIPTFPRSSSLSWTAMFSWRTLWCGGN